MTPRVEAALEDGAKLIESAAKASVPVRSGKLRDAIHTEKSDEGVSVIAGDGSAFYGHIVEFGSVQMGARPFLVPALESKRGEVDKLVSRALDNL